MKSLIKTYRYGTSREPGEGLRIGVARHVPRGVRREDWQRRNYFDLWLPLLAPSSELVARYRHNKISFAAFSRHYRSQMKAAESRQVIEFVASVSLFQPLSLGCFCEDESHCHRSLLRELVLKEAKKKASRLTALRDDADPDEQERFANPVCFAHQQK